MKPIYVKMSAFGSYAGEETVEFTDVNHGIFLITGDTGAGKTTIFDAITYALYDQTSGGKRDGEMMRSQYASEDTRTYVEMKFIYNEEYYTIIRYPRQERISKRKNKDGDYTKTMDMPSVELILPDGTAYRGKIKETNQKIVEIIGLDVNQFTQIAMIAQGDFLKLLHAPSKERKEIFAKIFNTRIYWRIEEELKSRVKAMYGRLEDNRKDILRELDSVQYIEGSIYEEAWASVAHFSENNPEQVITVLGQIIEEAKAKEEETSKELEANQNTLNQVVAELQTAEETNKLFTSLDKEQSKKALLDDRLEEMEAIRFQIASAKKAALIEPMERAYLNKHKEQQKCSQRVATIKEWLDNNEAVLKDRKKLSEEAEKEYRKLSPELAASISKINDLLPKYQLLEEQTAKYEVLLKNSKAARDEYDTTVEKMNRMMEHQNHLATEQQRLKPIAEGLLSFTQSKDKLIEKKAILDNLLTSLKALKKYREVYEACEQVFHMAEKAVQEKSASYNLVYQKFIEGQAGILAHELKEGCPCPVCGSTHHPQVAASADSSISQTELQKVKKALEEAEKELADKKDSLHQAKQSYEMQKTKANMEGSRSLGPDFDAEQVSSEEICAILWECAEQLTAETQKKKLAVKAKEDYDRNEKEQLELKELLDGCAQKKEAAAQTLKEIEIELVQSATHIKNLKISFLYETKQAAEAELATAREQSQRLEAAMTASAKSHRSLLEETNLKKGNLLSEENGLTRLLDEEQRLKVELEQEFLKQGFPDLAAYQAALLPELKLAQLEKAFQDYQKEVLEVENSLKIYRAQTAGKARIETITMEEKKAALEAEKLRLDVISKKVFGIRTCDETVIDKLTKLNHIRKTAREEYLVMSRLESTATGKAGQKRLNFQTYIQRRYFNSILNEANKRLYVMSNGQFILKCRNIEDLSNQGEVGLDLDVYSMVNDQTRDVKTLSGGESFMAALAMALGMADIIQNTASSIHIDTIFIDEGFGSLSEETRLQAINILNELSEGKRLVGIISHVTELKAQIETKLIVTKTDKGSKTRWDIGN